MMYITAPDVYIVEDGIDLYDIIHNIKILDRDVDLRLLICGVPSPLVSWNPSS